MKPKNGKRIAAGIVGGALVLVLLLAADAVAGDPVSRAWAEHRSIKYAEELYPEQTFRVLQSDGGSLFGYLVFVQSEQSEDTWFDIQTDFWFWTTDRRFEGQTPRHEFYVESGLNTRTRLEREAENAIDTILAEQLPQYRFVMEERYAFNGSSVTIGYSPHETEQQKLAETFLDYVPLDTPFSGQVLDSIPCKLYLQGFWPTAPTQADAEAVLTEVKTVLQENGYTFAHYELKLLDNSIQGREDPDPASDSNGQPSAQVTPMFQEKGAVTVVE